MKAMRTTFYVGLYSPGDPEDPDKRAALARDRQLIAERIISINYNAATIMQARGYWKGQQEPTLVIEHLGEWAKFDRRYARSVAKTLREALDQEAVGLTFERVRSEFI